MSKTKEELNKIKEEVETVNEKLQELTEEELEKVSGGACPSLEGKRTIVFGVDMMGTHMKRVRAPLIK